MSSRRQSPSPPPIRRHRSHSYGEVDIETTESSRRRPSRKQPPSPRPICRHRSLGRGGYDHDDESGRLYECVVTKDAGVDIYTDQRRLRSRTAPSPPLHLHVSAPHPQLSHPTAESPEDTPLSCPLTPSKTHLSPPEDIRHHLPPSRGRGFSNDLSDSTRTSPPLSCGQRVSHWGRRSTDTESSGHPSSGS